MKKEKQGPNYMIKLQYGNTNTFFIDGLLVDTDYAGTLPAFYREIKRNRIRIKDIHYILATHYHPDHMGLIGELVEQGATLLLIDKQETAVHSSDYIFERDKTPYIPVDESRAKVITCTESRAFLKGIGVSGEVIETPSHSPDSISLILDDGDCFVGDLEPAEYIEAYENNAQLKEDWERIMSSHPKRIFYAHRPEKTVTNISKEERAYDEQM